MNTPAQPESIAAAMRDLLRSLPSDDVRRRMDDRALRGWTESSRRAIRVLTLLGVDIASGLLGVQLLLASWTIVSAGGRRPVPLEIPLVAMVLFLQPLALQAFGAYKGGQTRTDLTRVSFAVCVAAGLGWAQARLFGQQSVDLPNKTAYLYAAAINTATIYAARLAIDFFIRRGFRYGYLRRRLLVIGSEAQAAAIKAQCERVAEADIQVVENIDPQMLAMDDRLKAIETAVSRKKVQAVLIASNLRLDLLPALITECFELGLTVNLLPGILQRINGSVYELRNTAAGPLLQLAPLRFDLPQLSIKRTMDVVLTALGLIVIWPLLAVIAVAIKLDSAGPVLFSQTRSGLGGRPFRMLKFRTMRVGADAEKELLQHLNEYSDARLFKIKKDPRVTRLGKFLRRASLDELPQLFNVLRGDMSLVGPRPCVPEELKHYSVAHRARLFVVPGMTGPWQVSGRNEILDFDTIVRMETDYIQSWSIGSDLLILLKTIPAVFRRGAY